MSKPVPKFSTSQTQEIVRALYRGFFGREPEPRGVQYWVTRIDSGESAMDVLGSFLLSPERRDRGTLGTEAKKLASKLGEALHLATPLLLVDVGAQRLDGEDHVYAPLLDYAKCRVIGFEPLEHRRRQREQVETDVHLSMRAAFIGDGGSHTFHINNPDATSSLLPLNGAVVRDLSDFCSFETVATENVTTTTLDEAISDVERVDFLKLDIQGFEYPALANARSVLSRTLAIHCEVEFIPLYQGQELFSEVDQLLRESGFRFVDFSRLSHSPLRFGPLVSEDQLGWGDAVYFKDVSRISDAIHLLIQAFIAAAVYGKLSLAHFLAREYDARAGTSHAAFFGD